MQRFLVRVNGKEYDVEVETLSDKSTSSKVETVKKDQAQERKEAAASTQTEFKEGRQVKAPLAGNILSIKVKAGDKIKRGDVLLTLEALKLENEIVSPCDGTVLSVNVEIGANVGTGDVLVIIDEQ